jgi:AbrB family looped-hinge helix DNA binding protein
MEDIMSLATVSPKGQITLPAKIRKKFRIRSRDKIQFLIRDDEIVIRPLRSFRALRGTIPSVEGDERKALGEAVSRHVVESEN